MTEVSRYYYRTDGDAGNPALLFLHGFMGSSADWGDIVPVFSPRRYCISIDLPGHGQTKVESEDDLRMGPCADSIVRIMDELSIERTDLVGYSMGGRLALYLAIHQPERFGRVVIESASPGLKTEAERLERMESDNKLAEKIRTTPLNEFLDDWYSQPLFSTIEKDSSGFASLLKRRLTNDPHGLASSLKGMGTGAQPSLWPHLAKITARLLLIVGEHDSKFKNIASEMSGLCRNAEVATIPGTGHNVHFENKQEYLRQLSLFLER